MGFFLISTFRQINHSKTKTCIVMIDMEYFQKQQNIDLNFISQ